MLLVMDYLLAMFGNVLIDTSRTAVKYTMDLSSCKELEEEFINYLPFNSFNDRGLKVFINLFFLLLLGTRYLYLEKAKSWGI